MKTTPQNNRKLSDDDKKIMAFFASQGYSRYRKLPDGEWVLLVPLRYTLSVCCGADLISTFKYRWCFSDPAEAIAFFEACENFDDIPEQRASLKGHRYGYRQPLIMEYDELGIPRW